MEVFVGIILIRIGTVGRLLHTWFSVVWFPKMQGLLDCLSGSSYDVRAACGSEEALGYPAFDLVETL